MKRPIEILLVEDNPGDADLLRCVLEEKGGERFRLTCETRLKRALYRLKKRDRFDVLLLDLNLPDSSGLRTVERAAASAPWMPIVVLSSWKDEEWAVRALQGGAQDYLVKGQVTVGLLSRTIPYAIERHRVLDELKKLNGRMEQLIHLDPLTGMLNRRGLARAIRVESRRIRRGGGALFSVLVDIDDFKRVNDCFGHAVGDVVLKKIAGRILSSLRATDIAARVGGDEFLLLVPEGKMRDAERVADRVCLAIAETRIETPQGALRITASLGVSAISKDNPTIDEMLVCTHDPLMDGKCSGKNRVRCSLGAGRKSPVIVESRRTSAVSSTRGESHDPRTTW